MVYFSPQAKKYVGSGYSRRELDMPSELRYDANIEFEQGYMTSRDGSSPGEQTEREGVHNEEGEEDARTVVSKDRCLL